MTHAISTSALAVRPAPRREPPFEGPGDGPGAVLRLVGPHDQQLPFAAALRSRRTNPLPAARAGLPDPARWGHRLLTGVMETAAGRRPLQQLASLLSPSVAYGLGQDFERCNRTRSPHWIAAARVSQVRASQPAPRVAEVSATLAVHGRVRAVALRVEEHRGRWRCTRMQLG